MKNKTIALIVTYNPDNNFHKRCMEVLDQFKNIVIVDNGSENSFTQKIRHLTSTENIHIIKNDTNHGLGYALNQGIDYALSEGYEWICTLDQDSGISKNFAASMLEVATEAKEKKFPLAFISPPYVDEKSGIIKSYGTDNSKISNCLNVDITITSGNFIPINTFLEVGKFDSDLFIDYLDYDFSIRCNRHNLRIIENKNVSLNHNLGKSELKKIFGLKFFITHHSTLRRYYITRNRIIVFRRHAQYSRKMAIAELFRFIIDIGKVTFFENEKLDKARAILLGVMDAAIGVKGEKILSKKFKP